MTMWVEARIAQYRRHSVFEPLRNEVFQPLSLIVNFVPGIFQYVVKEKLEQTMVPDQLPRPVLSGGSETDTTMLLI